MVFNWYFTIVLLWSFHTQARKFETDSLLPRPSTGLVTNSSRESERYLKYNSAPSKINLKIFDNELDHTFKFVTDNLNKMQRLESSLGWSDIQVKPDEPLHGQVINAYPENEAMHQGKNALVASKATIHLMHKLCRSRNLSKMECAKHMSNIKFTDKAQKELCSEQIKECTEKDYLSRYRSIDGSCNHRYERSRGQSLTSYKRLLFPDYLDGIQEPRRSVNKKNSLPSAREISSKLINHEDKLDDTRTMIVAEWTQFVSHDLSHTVSSKMLYSGKNIKCCTNSGRKLSPRYVHPFCAPIDITKDDKFYSKHGLKCMSYVRSVPALRPACTLGPIEQLNQATHFLDASHVYGSDEKRANHLRLMRDGLLKISINNGKSFLPIEEKKNSLFSYYVSGDPRVNTLPDLTVMHTIWLREHNRLAKQLQKLNPDWSDEKLYQEAREIVIAQIQHITYNEWLPTVVGKTYVEKIQFPVNAISYVDVIEDPSVSNSFATAAMRFGKSLFDDNFELHTEDRNIASKIRIKDYFNKPAIIEENFDSFIRGLTSQSSQRLDLNFAGDVTNQLYGNGKYGYDIVSLDIQRGRDHGLPSYTAFRSLCGLSEVKRFGDFVPDIPKDVAQTLSKIYKDPHDVDLLVGGLAEVPHGDSLLGPTFSCIIADQFLRTKFGDRYFYQQKEQPKPFTEDQLNEIKQTTLARILCNNGDSIESMQSNVFRRISTENHLIKCDDARIPQINLEYWREA